MPRRDPLTTLVFLVAVLIGGSNFVAVRFSNAELAPFWGAGLRFAIAAALLFALSLAFRLRLPRGRAALTGAAIYGTLGFGLFYAFMYRALIEATAALGAVVIALVPLLTLLLATAQGLERFRWRGLAGALVAAAGVAIVFADQVGGAVGLGSLLALLAGALCLAESAVAAKRYPRAHPIPYNAVAMVPGAALLLVLSLLAGEPLTLPAQQATWVALAYLILVGSTALFVAFLFVLGRWTASATSYATVLFPIVAALVGAALAGEHVSPGLAVGGAFVIAGVYLGALAPAPAPQPAPRPS
ncbi:MAG TPA: EamA family transporter [Candidatus Limnocylindrales bacterium]|nr:EamA family transporter [Candidatus Limnocylindrales bacterium]